MPGQPGYPAVTPLLNIATNYGGAQGGTTYGWWLDSYNSSGAATPVVFAESGPGVTDTNLTLEKWDHALRHVAVPVAERQRG